MPTLGPRRKTEPGRDSFWELVMVAVSFMKPMLEPQRSTDWRVMDRR
jgi:hypothetical protein